MTFTGAGNRRSIKYLIVYKLIIPFYISIKLYTIYIDFINIILSSLFISYTLLENFFFYHQQPKAVDDKKRNFHYGRFLKFSKKFLP